MASKRENYDNEILNLRAFYFTLLKKIWLLPLAAIIGAVVAGLIYFLANVVYAPARNYVTESTLYLYFAYDENKGSEVDAYNAYTWNLLIKTDDNTLGGLIDNYTDYNILSGIMENLEKAGYTEGVNVSRDEVAASIEADIPSDVRVMIFKVSNPDRELSAAIADAANDALVSYGKDNYAFNQIKLLGKTQTKLELIPDRMGVAAGLGAVIGFVLCVIMLLLIRSMDDMVCVPEDIERRYGLPVIGVLGKAGQETPSFFRNELLMYFKENIKAGDRIAIISVDDKTGTEYAENALLLLNDSCQHGLGDNMPFLTAMPLPGNDSGSSEALSKVDGVIMAACMDRHNGAMAVHLISLLRKIGCKNYGVVVTNADMKFLKRYLGL